MDPGVLSVELLLAGLRRRPLWLVARLGPVRQGHASALRQAQGNLD